MKAMTQDRYGEPDVLELRDIDLPVPGPKEVLVRVRAAGVDQGTWHQVSGLPLLGRLAFGLRRPRFPVPGMDVAGVVEKVGAEVTDFHPGDEVFGVGRGTFAEYATARTLVPKPPNVTFEQAAAVAVSGCTALTALRDLEAGQCVLVIGAGGGVGSYAVQLAVAMGAEVTGVCGPRKLELVRSLGARKVIDYRAEDVTGEYDLVLDIAGSRPFPVLRSLLTPRGSLVLIGSEEGGRWIGALDRPFGALLRSPFTSQRLRAPISLENKASLVRLAGLLADGTVTPAVDRTFALPDAAAAITYLRDGNVRGKVVVVP
ncbi:NAD(P)-dependent alcohol dehydrogenase [Actinophytocola oryzae]|uniref:NADPH:quinone reductase-like Zn-dependent oxidoreductase n=1 Tax=Actinophytocola oryzae TaxID=502181 RepID=A0A4V3FSK1_9PSEU|nr:NAD(P)-dependent alcohol dehydrogenase [Actinophytocola oryzae]TDV47771.1 NADPH:quinone reductase-like Zn-dependent oxidoreductase [Actinophytocola oryzae]